MLDDTSEQTQGLPIEIFSPWSNIIVKLKMHDEALKDLQELYDVTMKNYKSFGHQLVGQIEEEPEVTEEMRNKFPEWTNFCTSAVIEYVKTATLQTMTGDPVKMKEFMADQVLAKISTMWFVNQKPGEYNPIHIHTNCKVSSVCYLKTPKQQVVDRKPHFKADGNITFTNNTGTDALFSNASCSFVPKAGDMYLFGSLQHHMVWPYRSADPNDERISISFNADVTTKSSLEQSTKEAEMMYEEMKKHKESEVKNDKSTDVSDINKSG